MNNKTRQELKDDIARMHDMPWDYTHLHDCTCGSDDLEIAEFSNGNLDDGMYCGRVSCNSCGKEVVNTSEDPADVIWNRVNTVN